MTEDFLTAEEVSQRLRLSVETVKRLLREKKMPGYKFGGSWRIDKQQLERYIEEQSNLNKPEESK